MLVLELDCVFEMVSLHAVYNSAGEVAAVKSIRLCSHLVRWDSMQVKARNKAKMA